MIRSAIISVLAMAMVFLPGCEKSQNSTLCLGTFVERNAKITVCGKEYKCKISHTPEHFNSVTFLSPSNLEGFTVARNCDKYEISRKELEAEYSAKPLMENSCICFLMDVLDLADTPEEFEFQKKESGKTIYTGKNSLKDCEIIVGSENNAVCILISNLDAKIEFE